MWKAYRSCGYRYHWRQVTFLHWPYPAETVQALLPDGLTVETFDGTAWVGSSRC